MRTPIGGALIGWAGWPLMLVAVMAGCGSGQQSEEPAPSPAPNVSCRDLVLAPPRFAAETILPNGSRARITPAAGNHTITLADLSVGSMTARIDMQSGPGIPPYGMGPTDTACTRIKGEDYDALETTFISYKTEDTLARLPTAVIHKTRPHPHEDADWIAIGRASLLTGAEAKPGGMIPWLFQNGRVWAAQSGCGRYKCCLAVMPL